MDFLFRCSKCSYEFTVTSNDFSEYILKNPNFLRCPNCGQPAPKLITVTSEIWLTKTQVETINKLSKQLKISFSECVVQILERSYDAKG